MAVVLPDWWKTIYIYIYIYIYIMCLSVFGRHIRCLATVLFCNEIIRVVVIFVTVSQNYEQTC